MGSPFSLYPAINNETRKTTVTPDSFTVDDNSAIASTDGYVDILLTPRNAVASFIAHNTSYTGQFGNGLLQSNGGKLWFFASTLPVNETADTVTITHDATPDGTLLRAVILRDRPMLDSEKIVYVKLVTDNAGSGNTHFTTAGGLDWLVEDVDASTPGWQIKFDESGDPQFLIDAPQFQNNVDFAIVEPLTGNQIEALNSNGVGVDVYIDPADAEASRLNGNFASASNKTISLAAYNTSGIAGDSQVVPVYINPTASTQNRLQHAFPFVTDTIYVNSNTTNELIPVVYNANAAADGYRLRAISGEPFWSFAYNNTSTGTDTNTAFYTSTDLARFPFVKAA